MTCVYAAFLLLVALVTVAVVVLLESASSALVLAARDGRLETAAGTALAELDATEADEAIEDDLFFSAVEFPVVSIGRIIEPGAQATAVKLPKAVYSPMVTVNG